MKLYDVFHTRTTTWVGQVVAKNERDAVRVIRVAHPEPEWQFRAVEVSSSGRPRPASG
jgi:hypothetical protein